MGRRRQDQVTAAELRQARRYFVDLDGKDLLFWLPPDEALERVPAEERVRLMDRCIVHGYRATCRPILSTRTIGLLKDARAVVRLPDFEWDVALRRNNAAHPRELSGEGLLSILVWLGRNGLDVASFVNARRSVTPKQVQLLQLARKKVPGCEERYHGALTRLGGVTTSRDLDDRGFELMIALMEDAGFERQRPAPVAAPNFGHRPGFASPEQLDLIRALWREWSGAEDEAALSTWLERFHEVANLRFLTAAGAGKVITALKSMKRRRAAEASDGTAA